MALPASEFAGEVEEQLGLLQELVPDWISGKTASSGDFLFWYASLATDPSYPLLISPKMGDFFFFIRITNECNAS